LNHLTCINCNLSFNNFENQKLHFKSDFHRYNLKRNTVGLPPIEYELFIKKRDALINASVSESKDNISLINYSETNTIMTNNIITCHMCNKH